MQAEVVKFDLQEQIKQGLQRMEALIKDVENHKNPWVRIAATAEMRHHLEFATRALDIASRAEAVKEFETGVLEALAEAGITIKRRIIGLFEQRAQEETK